MRIITRIHFYEVHRGGIAFKPEMVSGSHFGSLAEIEGELYSCIIVHDSQLIIPGQTVDLQIVFLFPDLVLPKLHVGFKFFLNAVPRTHAAEAQIIEFIDETPTLQ
jgi:hypothetical protein